MAKTSLTDADRWERQFNDYVRGRLHGDRAKLQAVARYLNVSDDIIYKRIAGDTRWRLGDALAVIEYFESTPGEVMR